jgi:hypothetical protein
VLNITWAREHYKIGWRGFQAGIRGLRETGVLIRSSNGGNASAGGKRYAAEHLDSSSSTNFVAVPEKLLHERSTVVAFYIAVQLSKEAATPARIGRRIGIRSRITIAKLVEKLADRIAIDRELGAPILVVRHGYVFEHPRGVHKNVVDRIVVDRNVATQRRRKSPKKQ